MRPDAQQLLDCLPINIALLDSEGVVVLVNQAWRQFGATNGQCDPLCYVGRSYLEVCDHAANDGNEFASAAANGLRAVAAGWPEFTLKYPCNSPGEERWFELRARYLSTDRHGWVLVTHTDISELNISLAAAEMRARENELYRAIIDALPDLVFAKDRQGRFLAANYATAQIMQAGSATELIGKSDFNYYPPEIAAGFEADEETFFASGKTMIIEQPCTRVDGSAGWLCSLKAPLNDEQGRVIGYVGHGRDVTEAKLLDQALADARSQLMLQADEMRDLGEQAQKANQAKSDFLAAMSHEIRTPMTSVLGMTDLLVMDDLSPAQKRCIDTIRASGRHLLSIINDILDFSRIESGRMELERIDFAMADVIEHVQSILTPKAVEREIQLLVDQALGSSLVLRGDPTRLQQVLVNLVDNGLKFTAQGSVTLTVRQLQATSGGLRLRFEVQDTGSGIPRERQAELFQPFVQETDSVARLYGGSGLGLAICRRLVEAMGGVIGLESEPGRGSLFWFELPFELGNDVVTPKQSAFEPTQIRPLRVLVVDDVASNRLLFDAMLSRHGHSVLLAEDGAEAVNLVAREQLDVVLMDVQMPVMDGVEATQRIRRMPGPMAGVPILALTANVMHSERERFLAAGMNQCLTKPVIWPELFAALDSIAAAERLTAWPAPRPSLLASGETMSREMKGFPKK